MATDSVIRSANLWAGVTLAALVVWVLADAWTQTARLDALRAELHAPRPETAAEAAAADAAETLPDLDVRPGLWAHARAVGPVSVRTDLLLREDRTFVATVTGAVDGKEKLTASAAGRWRVKGHALALAVEEGAKGIFPTPARLALRQASDVAMTVGEGSTAARFERPENLRRAEAAREAEREAERARFAALPLQAVPAGRFGEWLGEQSIFWTGVAGIVWLALVVAGWSFVRRRC